MNLQHIPQIKHTESGNFFLLAGPCAIEGEEMALRIAEKLVGITDKLEIPFVFKGSFHFFCKILFLFFSAIHLRYHCPLRVLITFFISALRFSLLRILLALLKK